MSHRALHRTRGITLVEVMIVSVIFSAMIIASMTAFSNTVDYDKRLKDSRAAEIGSYDFEAKLAGIIRQATLSTGADDPNSYFIGSDGPVLEGDPGSDANTLTFSVVGTRLPYSTLGFQDEFESGNETLGPQGGVAEVTISMTPTCDPGGRSGLFIREQRPADGDPSQGGEERLLEEGMEEFSLEFFDGIDWITSWDTRSQTTRRLPAAVRITYRKVGFNDLRTLTVRLPNSDVTPDNPLEETTG